MKHDIINFENKVMGSVELNEKVFGLLPRKDILHRTVQWQRDCARAGTHKTKGISDISGTTKKPFAQKGTGRARAGSLRAPQMRGGAVIFGPVVRDHGYSLTKKFRSLALRMALSLKSKDMIILDTEAMKTSKTKDMLKNLENLKLKSALFVGGASFDENFKKAISNVPHMDILPSCGLNVLSLLKREKLVITKDGLAAVEARFTK